jgi:hypothetical protein
MQAVTHYPGLRRAMLSPRAAAHHPWTQTTNVGLFHLPAVGASLKQPSLKKTEHTRKAND